MTRPPKQKKTHQQRNRQRLLLLHTPRADTKNQNEVQRRQHQHQYQQPPQKQHCSYCCQNSHSGNLSFPYVLPLYVGTPLHVFTSVTIIPYTGTVDNAVPCTVYRPTCIFHELRTVLFYTQSTALTYPLRYLFCFVFVYGLARPGLARFQNGKRGLVKCAADGGEVHVTLKDRPPYSSWNVKWAIRYGLYRLTYVRYFCFRVFARVCALMYVWVHDFVGVSGTYIRNNHECASFGDGWMVFCCSSFCMYISPAFFFCSAVV